MKSESAVAMIRQLHVVSSVASTSGGEGLAALRFADAVAQTGSPVTLLTNDNLDQMTFSFNKKSNLSILSIQPTKNLLATLFVQYLFVRKIFEVEKFDIVHIHGMWTPLLAIVGLMAKRFDVPFIISPHGCLERYALEYKRSKKLLALKTYQGLILRAATLFIATAEQERESIRNLELTQPVAVIPNGVDVRSSSSRNSRHGEPKRLLFLSRLHPQKGLEDLILAWSRVRRPGWEVVIAGGDEIGYRSQLEVLIKSLGLQEEFKFVGFVEGAYKQNCFNTSDIFVLPSHSENFGIVVAEALANELPVITTKRSPWSELSSYRCGWWVDPGVEGISEALHEAMGSTPEELREMGRRGRQLMIEKYSWKEVGKAGFQISQWLLDRSRPKPRTVEFG